MRWRMLTLLFLARIALGFQFQTVSSVGDRLAGTFGLDYAAIGMLIGIFMAPGVFLSFPAGLSGRFGADRLLAGLGLGALALGGLVCAAAPGPGMIALGRLVSGAGALFATLYFTKMIADWFDGREMATAMSILVMSWPLGIAMGQVGHVWLAQHFGWRVPFAVASIYCALAALAVLAFYRPPHARSFATSQGPARLLPREWALILCAGIAWGVFNAGYVTWLSFGPKMLEATGTGVIAAASVISVGSWLMIFSGAACGQIVDRYGHADMVLAICIGGAMTALSLLAVPGAGLAASLLFGVVGIAPAGVIIALSGQAVAPERRAFGMGVFYTIYYAIMTAAPPAAGSILDRAGSVKGAIFFGACLFAMVLPAVLLFRRLKAGPRSGVLREGV